MCRNSSTNVQKAFFFGNSKYEKRDNKLIFYPTLASEISRHHGGALLNFFHASPMIYLVRTHSLLGYVVVVIFLLLIFWWFSFPLVCELFPLSRRGRPFVFVFAVAAATSRTTATCFRTERIFRKVCSNVELFLARRRSIFSGGANRVGNFPLLVCAWVRVMCFLSRLITIDRRFAESLR